jgi:hypothetical protein
MSWDGCHENARAIKIVGQYVGMSSRKREPCRISPPAVNTFDNLLVLLSLLTKGCYFVPNKVLFIPIIAFCYYQFPIKNSNGEENEK